MFNYFNKVFEADTNERRKVSFNLKENEKMIHNGKNYKFLFKNLDIDKNNCCKIIVMKKNSM